MNRYSIEFQGEKIALAYVSPHPTFEKQIVVSVVPLTRKGKWEDNNLEIKLENPLYDFFPEDTAETQAINEVMAQALIEPWKVKLISIKHWV
ncbi:hypothetical protein [Nitrosomonas sp.]|uniref:hypothetical protein n=1 Tax=Nitrosomonas sp. TaxID=42353 RepID=UPI0025CEC764|nr:hypothetical protein [Nitrosomonas sp.]